MRDERATTIPDVPRAPDGKWLPGASPNPSGQRRVMREIQEMLDAEHRTVENMREVFARLKALALGEVVDVFDRDGAKVGVALKADAGFMKLYLDRTLGPLKEMTDDELEPLMRDAPDVVVAWVRQLKGVA